MFVPATLMFAITIVIFLLTLDSLELGRLQREVNQKKVSSLK